MLNNEESSLFISNLRSFIRAGLPMDECMRSMTEIMPRHRDSWEELAVLTGQGASLSGAIERVNLLPPETRSAITAGEQSGRLLEVLQQCVKINDEIKKLKSEVGSKLFMPAFYLIGGLLLTVVYSLFVIPSATQQLKGDKRTGIIAACDALGDFFKHDWPYALGIATVALVWILVIRKQEWFRVFSFSLIAKMPVLGSGLSNIFCAIWVRYVVLLDRAGGLSYEEIMGGATSVIPLYYQEPFKLMMEDVQRSGDPMEGVNLKKKESNDPRHKWPMLLKIGLIASAKTGDIGSSLGEIADDMIDQGTRTVTRFLGTANLISLLITVVLSVGPMGALFMAQSQMMSTLK